MNVFLEHISFKLFPHFHTFNNIIIYGNTEAILAKQTPFEGNQRRFRNTNVDPRRAPILRRNTYNKAKLTNPLRIHYTSVEYSKVGTQSHIHFPGNKKNRFQPN